MHLVLLKALLYMLGVSASVPVLELACYAGYPFVAVCMSMAVGIPFGEAWLILHNTQGFDANGNVVCHNLFTTLTPSSQLTWCQLSLLTNSNHSNSDLGTRVGACQSMPELLCMTLSLHDSCDGGCWVLVALYVC